MLKEEVTTNSGVFIMMPENKEASFSLDFKQYNVTIQQGKKETIIPLQQLYKYEDRYSAPKGRELIENKTRVIHISKNVFDNDDEIEVLIQATFNPPKKDNSEVFVIDFLLNQDGSVQLLGSTYIGTGQGSDPVFAIIDDKAYYGVYDDRNLGNFLEPYQKLNAVPLVTNTKFTNGIVVYKKRNWEYAKEKEIPVEETIKSKQDFITKLIGNKEKSVTVTHAITYYDIDYNPTDTKKVKVNMVATYNNYHYNTRGIRSLMRDLGKCNSIKIIPVLMEYLEDNRSIDLPGDDYGNTTISLLAEKALSDIYVVNPNFFINYTDGFIYKDGLEKWWKKNQLNYK